MTQDFVIRISGMNPMKMYMEKYFKVPDDFSAFVYMSQYLQAEAVEIGIESPSSCKTLLSGNTLLADPMIVGR